MFNYPLQTILVLWSLAWGRRIYFKNCQWLVSDLWGEGKKKIMTQIFYGVPKQRKSHLKIKITNSNIISQHFAFVFWAACVILWLEPTVPTADIIQSALFEPEISFKIRKFLILFYIVAFQKLCFTLQRSFCLQLIPLLL